MENLKNKAKIVYVKGAIRSFSMDMEIPLLKVKHSLKFEYGNTWLELEPNSLSLIRDKLPFILFMKLVIESESYSSTMKVDSRFLIDLSSWSGRSCPSALSWLVNIIFLDENKQDVCEVFEFDTPKTIDVDHSKLFVNGENADITVECKNGEELKVHRCVLTTKSEVFEKMLSGDTLESKTRRVSCLYDKEVMSYVFEYIYCEKVDIKGNGREVFIAADFYQLQGLMKICKSTILKETTTSNAITALMFCHSYGPKLEDLKKCILMMISCNPKEVVNAKELMTVSEKLDNELTQDLISALLEPIKNLKIR